MGSNLLPNAMVPTFLTSVYLRLANIPDSNNTKRLSWLFEGEMYNLQVLSHVIYTQALDSKNQW